MPLGDQTREEGVTNFIPNINNRGSYIIEKQISLMGFLGFDTGSDDGAANGGINGEIAGSGLFEELFQRVELAGNGQRFEDGVVRSGGVREIGLLGSPVEEAKRERWVVEKMRIDDLGNQRRGERVTSNEFVKGLVK